MYTTGVRTRRRPAKAFAIAGTALALAAVALLLSSRGSERTTWAPIEVKPNLEDVQPDGGLYNRNTPSFLRTHHCLGADRHPAPRARLAGRRRGDARR